ncbi:hypothetical protein ACH5RR_023363 [Cinchona calisaya]|uniref:Replication protein A OB domain-containing protein n=1 Tax=Cinchona calisaya TaxID=153742 RepID=A0ABD2ZCB9_9GENT
MDIDNRWTIPHNVALVIKYWGHVCVEWCNQGRYLLKIVTSNYKFLNLLSAAHDCKKIKIRVMRMWDAININTGDIIALEMVLLDENVDGDINSINAHNFEFLEFNDVPSRFQVFTYLLDVVGVLSKMGPVQEVSRVCGSIKERDIQITNKSGEHMEVTLWGSVASQISDDTITESTQSSVLMISTLIVKEF